MKKANIITWVILGIILCVLGAYILAGGEEGAAIISTILITLGVGCFVTAGREQGEAKTADSFTKSLTDTTRPEKARRIEAITHLSQQGYSITTQEEGFIVVRKDKPPFSLLLFIVLLVAGLGVGGVIYLVWYATQKPEIKTYTIAA